MKSSPRYQIHPFGPDIKIPEKFSCLECPICRKTEPNPLTPAVKKRLVQQYPDQYLEWMDCILHMYPCGMVVRMIKLKQGDPEWCFKKWSARSASIKIPYIPSRDVRTKSVRIVRP